MHPSRVKHNHSDLYELLKFRISYTFYREINEIPDQEPIALTQKYAKLPENYLETYDFDKQTHKPYFINTFY